MAKFNSEAEFRKKIREGIIIDVDELYTKEDLILRLKRKLHGTQPTTRQIELASSELGLSEPSVIREPAREDYYYHGRRSRWIGRDTREEIIMIKGREVKRKRDVRTGRFK